MLRGKRGAYFFVIDAVVAGAIIVAALLLIFGSHSSKPERQTTVQEGEDFLDYLYSTSVREHDSTLINQMVDDGVITDLDRSLADQLVAFYYAGNTTELTDFAQDISSFNVPPDRGLLLYINSTLIYNSTLHKPMSTLNSSRLVLNPKRMSFLLVNQSALYGPVWIEVKVWA